jgi:ABC-2 type transport system ATP-binding protein
VLIAWTVGLSLLPLAARRQSLRPRALRKSAAPVGGGEAIELRGVVKHYGPVTAVDGLDLRVPSGEIVALLGPNGAGKTTTMSILLGLRQADGGQARLFGSSPRRAAARGQVGAMLQDSELMAGVGVGELLRFIRTLYPAPLDLVAVIDTADLGDLLRRRTDRLSGGQAQRVRFALAAAGNPALLVLDEPTAALDVQVRRDLWSALEDHAARHHTTVLFSTHYLEEADQHAERVVLIGAGRVIADGTPDEVKAAAGAGRIVRFRLLEGNPGQFAGTRGVTAVHADGQWITLHTTDADATIWALYNHRHAIAGIVVTEASLEEAFLTLVAQPPKQGDRAGMPLLSSPAV